MDGCEPQCGYWEPNPGLSEEYPVLLMADHFPSPNSLHFANFILMVSYTIFIYFQNLGKGTYLTQMELLMLYALTRRPNLQYSFISIRLLVVINECLSINSS